MDKTDVEESDGVYVALSLGRSQFLLLFIRVLN